jgi:SPP1 gp7 family putative phage head morphogenesis protein
MPGPKPDGPDKPDKPGAPGKPGLPDLKYALGLPPERAMAYLKAKGYAISFDWHEVLADAQAKSFTVAKAMTLDVLSTIREEVQKSLDQGLTLRQFQKNLTPRLQALGWWGKQEVTDPRTGEVRRAQLGSPYRLRTIYQTNMQTAYMAGRYQEQLANAKEQPFWMYVAVLDARTRPSHRALHGRTFKYDDPFWGSFYPPNGWNCRCRVRAMDGEAVTAKGRTVESGADHLSQVEVPVSAKSGKTASAAVFTDNTGRRIATDPGWGYNPGKSWPLFDANGGLPDCLDVSFADSFKPCVRIQPNQKTWKDYGRPDLRDVPAKLRLPAPALLDGGKTREEAATILNRALGLDKRPLLEVATPVSKVYLKPELLAHLVENPADARERYANFILPTLEDPYEVYLTAYEDGYRERYVGLFTGKNDLLVVARVNQDGSLLWNMMQANDKAMNKQRVGELLFGKK